MRVERQRSFLFGVPLDDGAQHVLGIGAVPMKLSSAKKTFPVPRLCQASSSLSTCVTGLKRTLRPYMTMMSQNSQVNGQPRVHCTTPWAYGRFNMDRRGTGESGMWIFSRST